MTDWQVFTLAIISSMIWIGRPMIDIVLITETQTNFFSGDNPFRLCIPRL